MNAVIGSAGNAGNDAGIESAGNATVGIAAAAESISVVSTLIGMLAGGRVACASGSTGVAAFPSAAGCDGGSPAGGA
jgi:hypothetical protein